ncbi:MAG: 3-phosphoshikimate 1-carboxyvinyltransferase [Terriglobales bacterium]
MLIRPARNIRGSLRLPGDKSISHRYAMLAGIADGCSRLENFATGADCAATLRCMEFLGCEVLRPAPGVKPPGVKEPGVNDSCVVEIEGNGPFLKSPSQPLDCGNSGSTIRMLAGILAGQKFSSELKGDSSLSRRPMERIVEPLRRMGARIAAQGEDGRPPLSIGESRLHGVEHLLRVASAQVKSCLLFAGLYAEGETVVLEPERTRDHGELALAAFGADVDVIARGRIRVRPGAPLKPVHALIPGDISTAAFFLGAAALFPDSNLVFDDLLLSPTRAAILDVLRALGLRLNILRVEERHGELSGALQARHGRLRGVSISGALSTALIDELPVLAAIAPYASEGVEIHDARELRVKESDRIAAVAANLRAMGAEVEEYDDGLRVLGNQRLHGAELQSFGDHRIAMAFAVAALRADGDSHIQGAEAAGISFPEFYATLENLVER